MTPPTPTNLTPIDLRRAPRPLRVWLLGLAATLFIGAWLAWWLLEAGDNTTARGLKIQHPAAAHLAANIGHKNQEQVTQVVTQVAEQFQSTPIRIITPHHNLDTTAATVGLKVDVAETVAQIMANHSASSNPIRWTTNLFSSVFRSSQVGLRFVLAPDPNQIQQLQESLIQPPSEPSIALADGAFQLIGGSAGQSADITSALPELLTAANAGQASLELSATVQPIAPQQSDAFVAQQTEQINQITDQGLTITVEGVTKQIPPAELRSWVFLRFHDGFEDGLEVGRWEYGISQQRLQNHLAELFSELASPAGEPVITIKNNIPTLVVDMPAMLCCEAEARQKILSALRDTQTHVTLELRAADDPVDQSWLKNRGIVELTGNFTTFFAADPTRASNTRRMAEALQGAIIYPGETFSVNNFVGERTVENGFVADGEGVSQVVSTLFTAAFNAGMDFGEYQSHSIDHPRYRRGLDATIAWPEPDFKFSNPNPYAMLIWPTVTPRSVTVRLYSTKHAKVEWTNRYEEVEGSCIKRTTERSRTYADGTVTADAVVALYHLSVEQPCTTSNHNNAHLPR
ncbi:MAG: VanW family protein [bacterium]|nr:VanW family protein [bacterium]